VARACWAGAIGHHVRHDGRRLRCKVEMKLHEFITLCDLCSQRGVLLCGHVYRKQLRKDVIDRSVVKRLRS